MSVFMVIVSLVMACMALPHIWTMMKTSSSRDQSLVGLFGVAGGICCWIWYGFSIANMTLVYCNGIMLATYLAYIGTAVYYRIKSVPS